MKNFRLIGTVLWAAALIGCETTNQAGVGNQEQKRLAQIQREQEEAAQYDQSDLNLWNSEQRRIVNQSNPAIKY